MALEATAQQNPLRDTGANTSSPATSSSDGREGRADDGASGTAASTETPPTPEMTVGERVPRASSASSLTLASERSGITIEQLFKKGLYGVIVLTSVLTVILNRLFRQNHSVVIACIFWFLVNIGIQITTAFPFVRAFPEKCDDPLSRRVVQACSLWFATCVGVIGVFIVNATHNTPKVLDSMYDDATHGTEGDAAFFVGGLGYFGMFLYLVVRACWGNPQYRQSYMVYIAVLVAIMGTGVEYTFGLTVWMIVLLALISAGCYVVYSDAKSLRIDRDVGYVMVACLVVSGVQKTLGQFITGYMFCRSSSDFMESSRSWEFFVVIMGWSLAMLLLIVFTRAVSEVTFDRPTSHAIIWTIQFPFYVYSELIFLDLNYQEFKFWVLLCGNMIVVYLNDSGLVGYLLDKAKKHSSHVEEPETAAAATSDDTADDATDNAASSAGSAGTAAGEGAGAGASDDLPRVNSNSLLPNINSAAVVSKISSRGFAMVATTFISAASALVGDPDRLMDVSKSFQDELVLNHRAQSQIRLLERSASFAVCFTVSFDLLCRRVRLGQASVYHESTSEQLTVCIGLMISLVALLITQRLSVRMEKEIMLKAQHELNQIHSAFNEHVRRSTLEIELGTLSVVEVLDADEERVSDEEARAEEGEEVKEEGESGEGRLDREVASPDLWKALKVEEEVYLARNGIFFLGVTAYNLLWIIGKVSIIRSSVDCKS